ncbi:MAG: hypothetical protein M1822_005260 [Bathelium mastoideum]|nr:MAG: hypothetical protein M1822_005260 [Bathelium mastoideum]
MSGTGRKCKCGFNPCRCREVSPTPAPIPLTSRSAQAGSAGPRRTIPVPASIQTGMKSSGAGSQGGTSKSGSRADAPKSSKPAKSASTEAVPPPSKKDGQSAAATEPGKPAKGESTEAVPSLSKKGKQPAEGPRKPTQPTYKPEKGESSASAAKQAALPEQEQTHSPLDIVPEEEATAFGLSIETLNEVLKGVEKFSDYDSRKTVVGLSRASKQLHERIHPMLYRSHKIASWRIDGPFIRTLMEDEKSCKSVRIVRYAAEGYRESMAPKVGLTADQKKRQMDVIRTLGSPLQTQWLHDLELNLPDACMALLVVVAQWIEKLNLADERRHVGDDHVDMGELDYFATDLMRRPVLGGGAQPGQGGAPPPGQGGAPPPGQGGTAQPAQAQPTVIHPVQRGQPVERGKIGTSQPGPKKPPKFQNLKALALDLYHVPEAYRSLQHTLTIPSLMLLAIRRLHATPPVPGPLQQPQASRIQHLIIHRSLISTNNFIQLLACFNGLKTLDYSSRHYDVFGPAVTHRLDYATFTERLLSCHGRTLEKFRLREWLGITAPIRSLREFSLLKKIMVMQDMIPSPNNRDDTIKELSDYLPVSVVRLVIVPRLLYMPTHRETHVREKLHNLAQKRNEIPSLVGKDTTFTKLKKKDVIQYRTRPNPDQEYQEDTETVYSKMRAKFTGRLELNLIEDDYDDGTDMNVDFHEFKVSP